MLDNHSNTGKCLRAVRSGQWHGQDWTVKVRSVAFTTAGKSVQAQPHSKRTSEQARQEESKSSHVLVSTSAVQHNDRPRAVLTRAL
jgi:hypothetical protein